MNTSRTIADAVLCGDEAVLGALLSRPLVVARNNFVERPWGGMRIRQHKGLHPLPEQADTTGLGIGEAFELAAFDEDEEASRYPSYVVFGDGSRLSLARLLERHGERILGERFVNRYGPCLPVLPKTLDVRELLSVQGHPPGQPEVYIILEAEPDATLAVGFNRDMDAETLERRLTAGLRLQQRLVELLAREADLLSLQQLVAPWFAAREAVVDSIGSELAVFLSPAASAAEAARLLEDLKTCYWEMLDSLNAIEAVPGQVIYNATPGRLMSSGRLPSAEVHALGNPGRREVLALEIRLPGPTFRAWDNVRFPPRRVDVAAAIDALNLRATTQDDFLCEERPDPARPGVTCSVDSEFFRVEHFRPGTGVACPLTESQPSCLHVVAGEAVVRGPDNRNVARLRRGEAALVPVGLRGYSLEAAAEATAAAQAAAAAQAEPEPEAAAETHIVSVTLPCD